jgi:hypothetical protein
MSDEEYYFKDYEHRSKKGRYSVVYTVAKFNHRRYPEAIYEVKQGRFGWECQCAAFTQHGVQCKHIQMIQDWVKAGKPSPFDYLFTEAPEKKPVGTVKRSTQASKKRA